ncbi:MAG: hydroxyacid dehydrogenase [Candidatus Bipolaricaulia bacterium]
MNRKALIVQSIDRAGIDLLQSAGLKVVLLPEPTKKSLLEQVEGCDAILVRTAPITRQVIEAGSRLKVIARHGVGMDNVDMRAATEHGIVVVNTPEANAESVAEHVVGLMLALAKNLLKADRALRADRFEVRHTYIGIDLSGKTLGIIGMGRIGSAVARKAVHGFNMTVLGYDPYLTPDRVPESITLTDDLNALLQSSDFISIHSPLTQETRGLIGERELGRMRPTAYLINAARGGIVNERALIRTLQQRTIAGAALDVYEAEPPSPDNPLFAMENVVVTPHMASHTREALIRMATHAAEGIVEVLRGDRPHYPVNPEVLDRE